MITKIIVAILAIGLLSGLFYLGALALEKIADKKFMKNSWVYTIISFTLMLIIPASITINVAKLFI